MSEVVETEEQVKHRFKTASVGLDAMAIVSDLIQGTEGGQHEYRKLLLLAAILVELKNFNAVAMHPMVVVDSRELDTDYKPSSIAKKTLDKK